MVIDVNTVSFDGETMTNNEWAKKVTGWSAMSVYESIIPKGDTKTLHEIRLEKMDEMEN